MVTRTASTRTDLPGFALNVMSHADGSMTRSTPRVPRLRGSTMLPLLMCLACRLSCLSLPLPPACTTSRPCLATCIANAATCKREVSPAVFHSSTLQPIRVHSRPYFPGTFHVQFVLAVSSTPPPLPLPRFSDFYHQDDMTTLSCLLTRIFAPMLLFATVCRQLQWQRGGQRPSLKS